MWRCEVRGERNVRLRRGYMLHYETYVTTLHAKLVPICYK
jgi:hypothetical protein